MINFSSSPVYIPRFYHSHLSIPIMTSAAEHPIPDIPATTAISSIDSEGISLHVKTWVCLKPVHKPTFFFSPC